LQLAGATGNRRFYYAPSVAFDRQRRLQIAIGSGYRARPTETTTQDRFYVFEDRDALKLPANTPPLVEEGNLGDITNQLQLTDSNKLGWFIDLSRNPGEKVLAEPLIFNNSVIFTSYQPDFQGGNNACNLSGNIPRAYMMALEDGRPMADLDKSGNQNTFTQTDRLMVLSTVQFIPSSPYITFDTDGRSRGGGNGGGGSGGGGSGGGGGGGGGNPPAQPPLCANAFVNQNRLGTFCRLGNRVSWRN